MTDTPASIMREKWTPDLLTLPTTYYDVSVSCNRFSKTEIHQFDASGTDALSQSQILGEKRAPGIKNEKKTSNCKVERSSLINNIPVRQVDIAELVETGGSDHDVSDGVGVAVGAGASVLKISAAIVVNAARDADGAASVRRAV